MGLGLVPLTGAERIMEARWGASGVGQENLNADRKWIPLWGQQAPDYEICVSGSCEVCVNAS